MFISTLRKFLQNPAVNDVYLYTIVNCDLLDALYRVRRIKIANDIINQESDINFPRTSQFQASFDCVNKDKFSKTDLSDIPELPSELKTIDCLKK